MRWNKLYDGTRESLIPKSHRPKTPHPNAHTEEELNWIRNYHRRNPNISLCELYGKLRTEKGYTRHPGSLYRVFIRLGYRQKVDGYTGCPFGALVPDDDDITGNDASVGDGLGCILLAVEDPGLSAELHHLRTDRRLLDDGSLGGEVALQDGDTSLLVASLLGVENL